MSFYFCGPVIYKGRLSSRKKKLSQLKLSRSKTKKPENVFIYNRLLKTSSLPSKKSLLFKKVYQNSEMIVPLYKWNKYILFCQHQKDLNTNDDCVCTKLINCRTEAVWQRVENAAVPDAYCHMVGNTLYAELRDWLNDLQFTTLLLGDGLSNRSAAVTVRFGNLLFGRGHSDSPRTIRVRKKKS